MIFEKGDLRITVLTSRLLRVETGHFTDLPTQTVPNRDLDEVACTLSESPGKVIVRTDDAVFEVNTKRKNLISVTFPDGNRVADFAKGNLLGTARTLDRANGPVKLEKGILSRSGVAVLDDSKRLLLHPDGTITPRPACTDRYYFAYGHNYQAALWDFFRLTGEVPLIPKFALGNWWSRYRAYTQEEYRSLMLQFQNRKLPITVATIDMDWHWTDVVQRFGKEAKPARAQNKEELLFNTLMPGWTGYSWNTELFPDHKELLSWLHEQGLHVTLNVHPSQGIRFFEDCYEAVCRHLGKDPAAKECIPFDAADPTFWEAYFTHIHHPLEAEGVDFWWLDWQQGTNTRIPGLDPLWALNHYHSSDSEKNGKRPLILSRYAGMGSHRYPLGFSGDTIVTWKSLRFQPYFTNTAANAGYTWWSHDIGGHMQGVQDDELYLRWLQYGVFSPINRLHSSNSDFMGKEPWKRSWAVAKIAEDFLRLRHKLIPYLYTANYRTHSAGVPICMPLYYRYDCQDAYDAKNCYFFGEHLLVCPITEPTDKRLNLASGEVWLPEGRWTDIFNGCIYEGGRWVKMYRDLDSIPVLARPGTIVPMFRNADTNDLSLAQPLEIHIWRGNGAFDLYEDDGESMAYRDGNYAITHFQLEEEGNRLRLTITPPTESQGLLPESREMWLKFRDVETDELCVRVGSAPVVVELADCTPTQNPPVEELRSQILTRLQAQNRWKNRHLNERLPPFVRSAMAELDALQRGNNDPKE